MNGIDGRWDLAAIAAAAPSKPKGPDSPYDNPMDISNLPQEADPPSPPEDPAFFSDDSATTFHTDPYCEVELDIDILQEDTQDIGPWLFNVPVAAVRGADRIASVTAYLIKREGIQVRDNKKKSFRQALRDEDDFMDVMLESPKIFNWLGQARPDFLVSMEAYFGDDERRLYRKSGDATDHPLSRAWILLIRDIAVNAEYRRLGIGGNMVRRMLQTVAELADKADRPLLVAVQPKSYEEIPYNKLIQMNTIVYERRVNEAFWESINFSRFPRVDSGFIGPWHFWSGSHFLPLKKRIVIPDNVKERNTRLATPSPRARPPWQTHKTHSDVDDDNLSNFSDDTTSENAMGALFDDPSEPTMSPQQARDIRSLMKTMSANGEPYRLRPIKIRVPQSSFAQSSFPQPGPRQNPFRSRSGCGVAPLPTVRQEGASDSTSKAKAKSMRNEFLPSQSGSRFLDGDEDDDESEGGMGNLENVSKEDLIACGIIDGEASDDYDWF